MYSQDRARKKGAKALNRKAHSPKVQRACQFMMIQSFVCISCLPHLPPDVKHQTSPPAHFIAQVLQLQVTGTGRTTMVDASPTMTAARLSRVIAARTGVSQGSFALYYRSRPIYGTLAESGVASGSTIELKSRGRGGGPEPPATSSGEVEIETRPASMDEPPAGWARGATAMISGGPEPQATNSLEVAVETRPTSVEKPPASVVRGPTAMMRGYDRDGDGNFSRDEVRAMAVDFIKEKKTRQLATKVAIAMGLMFFWSSV